MEIRDEATVMTVKKTIGNVADIDVPRLEIKRTGDDLVDHVGVKWIYLVCPHCNTYTKFYPKYTIIVQQPDDETEASERDFHSLAACECCEDIIYLRCVEYDFDPDWYFGYQYHHPQSSFIHSPTDLPSTVFTSFSEAHKCLLAEAYLATAVMCRRTIEALLHDRGVDKKLTLAAGLQKVAKDLTLHESMVKVADIVRFIGNIGAHADEENQITKDQAQEIYRLTDRLIEMIYVIPLKIQQMKDKIDAGKKKGMGSAATKPTS